MYSVTACFFAPVHGAAWQKGTKRNQQQQLINRCESVLVVMRRHDCFAKPQSEVAVLAARFGSPVRGVFNDCPIQVTIYLLA
jgi:hypothetical protein